MPFTSLNFFMLVYNLMVSFCMGLYVSFEVDIVFFCT
jgi:hypothetical protein